MASRAPAAEEKDDPADYGCEILPWITLGVTRERYMEISKDGARTPWEIMGDTKERYLELAKPIMTVEQRLIATLDEAPLIVNGTYVDMGGRTRRSCYTLFGGDMRREFGWGELHVVDAYCAKHPEKHVKINEKRQFVYPCGRIEN